MNILILYTVKVKGTIFRYQNILRVPGNINIYIYINYNNTSKMIVQVFSNGLVSILLTEFIEEAVYQIFLWIENLR